MIHNILKDGQPRETGYYNCYYAKEDLENGTPVANYWDGSYWYGDEDCDVLMGFGNIEDDWFQEYYEGVKK